MSNDKMLTWRHRVAVVTGASKGIGARIAVQLAQAGVIVVGISRHPELVDELNKEVEGDNKIYSHYCDLRDERNIVETFAWIREKFYVIHILVNNAGILKANFLSESTTEDIKDLFNMNVVATSLCLRETLKHMRSTKTIGHIIIINSILGHKIPEVPVPLFSVYPSTKHALTALCQTVRQEIQFHKLNVKLTSVSPGMVDTDFLKVYSSTIAEFPKLQADDVAKAVIYALDTPDNVQVEEIILQAVQRFPKQ